MTAPLASAAAEAVQALGRLLDEWYKASRAAPDATAFEVAMARGYPFGSDLDDVVARACAWSDGVAALVRDADGTAGYVAAVQAALNNRNPVVVAYFSRVRPCTECGNHVDPADDDPGWPHVFLPGTLSPIVGCEGYRIVDPAVVGIAAPHWEPTDEWRSIVDWVRACTGDAR